MLRRELLLAAASLAACATTPAPRTQVMVIATVHRLHERIPTYSYDILYQRIRDFAPTAIGVEIRPEDIREPRDYRQRYYPHEMVELSEEYAVIATGIDWLGPTIEGQLIPDGYFQSMEIKVLERELENDPTARSEALDALNAQKQPLIRTATPQSLNDGRYDAINREYYRVLRELRTRTRYQPLTDFYAARDAHLDANAVALIRANPGGRVAIVIGADHRSFMIDALTTAFGAEIELVPV
jgi:hypothetical protein